MRAEGVADLLELRLDRRTLVEDYEDLLVDRSRGLCVGQSVVFVFVFVFGGVVCVRVIFCIALCYGCCY